MSTRRSLATDALAGGDVRPWRALSRILRPHWADLVVALVFFAIKDSPQWVIPILTSNIINAVVHGGQLTPIWLNFGLAVLILGQNLPSSMVWVARFNRVVRWTAAEMRNALASRLQELSIGFHNRTSSSVVQTKIVRDVENVELMLQQASQPGLSAINVLIGALITTAVRVPAFVLVFAITIPLGVWLVRMLRERASSRNEVFRRSVEQLSARVGEMGSLMPITRAHGLEEVATTRVSDAAEGVRDAGLQLDRLNGRFNAVAWISYQLLGVACLVIAATLSVTRVIPISPGDVVLLSTYFTILTNGIINLLGLAPLMQRGRESIRSIAEVMQDPDIEDNRGKALVTSVRGGFELREVVVRYGSRPGAERAFGADAKNTYFSQTISEGEASTDRRALDGISLVIAPGQTVAFVGATGSGKSTLVNTVLGFVRPASGQVLLDGVDMQTLDLRSYRQHVSVVPQESVLFEGSIRANVSYGIEGVGDAEVRAALEGANAWGFVSELPDGWNTAVGERGAALSGGQRQRIAIARALIRDPRVLFLDEATSALDAESEAAVRDALASLMRGRTTLVVAHRLSTIRSADRIVVLDHGRIAEQGTHEQLLALDGLYARLHRLQSE